MQVWHGTSFELLVAFHHFVAGSEFDVFIAVDLNT